MYLFLNLRRYPPGAGRHTPAYYGAVITRSRRSRRHTVVMPVSTPLVGAARRAAPRLRGGRGGRRARHGSVPDDSSCGELALILLPQSERSEFSLSEFRHFDVLFLRK